MSGEFSRIAEISRRLATRAADVRIGIGDDAAVLTPSSAHPVVSVDCAVEEVHFRRDFASWRQIGFRSLVAALSDLAAMGACPRAALVAMIVPAAFQDQWLFEIADGLADAARQYGSPVVGGNLSAGAQLSITSTVLGDAGTVVLTRSGARACDRLYVTGTVGEAALGLRCLQAGFDRPAAARFIERWRTPAAKISEGRKLLDIATAAIDISDGLLQDLGHICEASGVSAELAVADLPLGTGAIALAPQLGCDALQAALSGGEDYELLFTAPDNASAHALGTCVGTIIGGSGPITLLDTDGQKLPAPLTGYAHWREA
jgi:thiamine-monophosphate kinase